MWLAWTFLLLSFSTAILAYAECDDLRARIDSTTRMLHRGAHKEVKGAVLRPQNESVVLKRGPANTLNRELFVYEVLLHKAALVPHLYGYCLRSSDILFVQERVLPLAYVQMCLPSLSASARLLLLESAARLIRGLVQLDLVHCDFHRGQVGLRLQGAVPELVLLDSEQLQLAADVNRALHQPCSADQQCRKMYQCLSNHRPYTDQRCGAERCAELAPAYVLVAVLADLVEPLLFPTPELSLADFAADSPLFAENGSLSDAAPPAPAAPPFEPQVEQQLRQLLASMRQTTDTATLQYRISIDRVVSSVAQLRANATTPLSDADRDAFRRCAAQEEEVATRACKDKRYC